MAAATAALLAALAALEQRGAPRYAACPDRAGSLLETTCIVTPRPRGDVKHLVFWLVPKAGSQTARGFAARWPRIFEERGLATPSAAGARYAECAAARSVAPSRTQQLGGVMAPCGGACVRRFVSEGALVFGIVRDPVAKFLSGYAYTRRRAAVRCRARDCPAECPASAWRAADRPARCRAGERFANRTSGDEPDGGLARLAEYARSLVAETPAAFGACAAERLGRCLGWDRARLARAPTLADDDMHVMPHAFKYCAALRDAPGAARPTLALRLDRLADELPALAHLAMADARNVTRAERGAVAAAARAATPHLNAGRRDPATRARSDAVLRDARVMAPLCAYLKADYALFPFFRPPPLCLELGIM